MAYITKASGTGDTEQVIQELLQKLLQKLPLSCHRQAEDACLALKKGDGATARPF